MGLLNVTNLTDNPEKMIEESFMNTFEMVEKEFGFKISDDEKYKFIDEQIKSLENYMNESKNNELLKIINNYLVNFDYYAAVKEYLKFKYLKFKSTN